MSSPFSQLQNLINKLLSYDPHSLQLLGGLAGKRLLLDIEDLGYKILILPSEQGLTVSLYESGDVDVTLRGRAFSLLALVTADHEAASVMPSDLEIKGDIHLAQRLQAVIRQLNIDWEEMFAEYLGDSVARKLSLIGRYGKQRLFESRQSLKRNLSDYLRFEQTILPDQSLVDEFIQDVDHLRNDVERLKLRIERLSGQPEE